MNAAHAGPDFDFSGDALSRLIAGEDGRKSGRGDNADTSDDRGGQQSFVQQMRNRASDMVVSSMKFLGVPYVRGGTSASNGFDCSGFTRYIFEHSLGLVLPRRADEQASAAGLVKVKRDELKPGDLVFFNTLRRTFSHVGIYIGEGKFIHSPRPGGEVRVEDMGQSYWTKRFTGARRVPQIDASVTTTAFTAIDRAPAVSGGPSTGSSVSRSASSFSTSTFGSAPGASQDPLGLQSNSNSAVPAAP